MSAKIGVRIWGQKMRSTVGGNKCGQKMRPTVDVKSCGHLPDLGWGIVWNDRTTANAMKSKHFSCGAKIAKSSALGSFSGPIGRSFSAVIFTGHFQWTSSAVILGGQKLGSS
jgi:hypothetical protein